MYAPIRSWYFCRAASVLPEGGTAGSRPVVEIIFMFTPRCKMQLSCSSNGQLSRTAGGLEVVTTGGCGCPSLLPRLAQGAIAMEQL